MSWLSKLFGKKPKTRTIEDIKKESGELQGRKIKIITRSFSDDYGAVEHEMRRK